MIEPFTFRVAFYLTELIFREFCHKICDEKGFKAIFKSQNNFLGVRMLDSMLQISISIFAYSLLCNLE